MAKKTLRTADDFGTDELGFNITDPYSRFWMSSGFKSSACVYFDTDNWIAFGSGCEYGYVRCVKDSI